MTEMPVSPLILLEECVFALRVLHTILAHAHLSLGVQTVESLLADIATTLGLPTQEETP